ncbi:NUDIX hydrolase [Candidatus Woesearchaeota archaeon]|nr:NUDIX hydrolase [Candidatus Woesearchaeota archaeon]
MVEYDEFLDLVDQRDRVIGRERRSLVYAQGLSNFRVINAFIRNSKGELWIPRRTAAKKMFPLCLDMSVGGHVESGETYEQAFKRETKEETNLDAERLPYIFLGKLTPHEHDVSAYQKVYEIRYDSVPDYNKNDFVEDFWIRPGELLERIEAGEKAKGDLPKLVRIFYRKEL